MAYDNRPIMLELILAPLLVLSLASPSLAHQIRISNERPKQGETIEVTVTESRSEVGPNSSLPSPTQAPGSPSKDSLSEGSLSTGSPSKGSASKDSLSGNRLPQKFTSDSAGAAPQLLSSLTFNKNTYRLFPKHDESGPFAYSALLAMPADIKPGKYRLTVGSEKLTIEVQNAGFAVQHLHLPSSKDNFLMSPGEEEAVEGAKETLSPDRLWTGPFSAPSRSRVSASFGLRRVVNGKLLDDYFHSGLDFAAPLGSPITACANGKVVMVGRGFRLHGNTVCIDHGQGVVSFYLHMQKITVKLGESVTQGEKIGTVGQSGRATGPHLHFSVYVNKVAANPREWFKNAFTD